MVATIGVHGGAGRDDVATRPTRQAGVLRAADVGWAVLAAGGTALDAVVEAVAVLEDDPAFNAGLGAVLTEDGTVELDASVMTGETLAAGAVGAVAGIANPVRLARAVLDEGREVFLVGPPAAVLAARHGLRIVAPGALVTEDARRRWRAGRAAPGETVGAVACDATGHVAAATSTGGVAGKRPGRIGDSAVIGAGTWADDRTAAGSATGPGELILRLGMTRMACDLVTAGAAPDAAARRALAELQARLAGTAGLILVDATGRVGSAFTTDGMPCAWRADGMPGAALR
jgi:L-asparaginase / beta-aspartyl-peptidase